MPHQVILVGASGLIGSHLLSAQIKSDEKNRVILLLRAPLNRTDPKVQQLIINFDEMEHFTSDIMGDIIYSCLGTTKSKTPDSKLYRKFDLKYPLSLAKIGLENGVSLFHLVSSMGGNKKSPGSYLNLKGELEEKLKQLSIPSLHIYQPSLLTGKRSKKRSGEQIATLLFKLIEPIFGGLLKKYRSIKAETVAQAMTNQSLKDLKGTFTYPSNQIQELA